MTKNKQQSPVAQIETFRDVRGWALANMVQSEPDCFNGIVAVRRFRVTVEVIEEPDEVVAERIRKLWRECNNYHHWKPLQDAARQVGLELSRDECGKDKAIQ